MTGDNFAIELTHPLRLAGWAIVAWLVYYFYRSLVDLPRSQQWVSLGVRTVIVTLLVLALAGLTLLRSTSEKFVVFLIDRSLSIGAESSEAVDEFLDKALESVAGNRVAFLPFDVGPGDLTVERAKPTSD